MASNDFFDEYYRFDCEGYVSPNGDLLRFQNELKSNLFILPYGKYTFVSSILFDAYSLLSDDFDTIIFFIPTKSLRSEFFMTFTNEFLEDLNCLIAVNFDLLKFLENSIGLIRGDFDFDFEQKLKIHIDFVRAMHPNKKILPLFYNDLQIGNLTEVLNKCWDKYLLVFLGNLSRGFGYSDAKKYDKLTANFIENSIVRSYSNEDFEGYLILNELLDFVKVKRFSFVRLALLNSGDVSSNLASTIGFGAWFLYEGHVAELLSKFFRNLIKGFIRYSLIRTLNVACYTCFTLPQIFNQEMKIFVCIEKNGRVRGCSGSYKTPELLYKALVKRVFGAAFSDNRFSPIKLEELDELKFSVTIVAENIMESVLIEL